MDETKDPVDLYRRVTAEEFGRFAEAKGIAAKCVCGVSRWGVIDPEEIAGHPVTAGFMFMQDDGVGVGGVPTIVVFCQNCGYVRTFFKGVVLDWLSREVVGAENVKTVEATKGGQGDGD